jgi:uncharacterized membrane protein
VELCDGNPQSQATAQIAGHPIHPMLIPFPIAFLVAAFVCDLIFWRTGNSAWSTASLYLLEAALVTAALAAIAGLMDFLSDERIREMSSAWHHMIGNVVAVLLSLLNWYWRYTGGEAAVIPLGPHPIHAGGPHPALYRLARLGDGVCRSRRVEEAPEQR